MKVHKVTLTGATTITIAAGQNKMVKIPVAPEGAIAKFVLFQSGGTSVAYTCDLFDKMILAEGAHTTSLPANAELYRVFPTKTALSGAAITEYTTGELGYSYRNGDGNQTNPGRYLWLHIRPTAAGTETTWDLAMTIENDIG